MAAPKAIPRYVRVGPRLAKLIRRLSRPLYGGREVDAITVAHTVLCLIWPVPLDLQLHEAHHSWQASEMEPTWLPRWLGRGSVGVLRYWFAYSLEYLRHGYYNNRFEREARIYAGQEGPE